MKCGSLYDIITTYVISVAHKIGGIGAISRALVEDISREFARDIKV